MHIPKERKRLTHLLQSLKNIEILDAVGDPVLAIEKVVCQKPDLVFLNVEMPQKNGFEVMNSIRSKGFNPSFVFVTNYTQYSIKAIKEAVFDYLLHPIDIVELTTTIKRFRNRKPIKIVNSELIANLTCREQEILQLALEGLTSQEIADKLFIGKTTVDTHRKKILEKTGLKRITDFLLAQSFSKRE